MRTNFNRNAHSHHWILNLTTKAAHNVAITKTIAVRLEEGR